MSVKLMSLVFEIEMEDLKTENGKVVSASACAFVLLSLADHANDEGEHIYPSLSKLCSKTKLTKPTVINALSALRVAGYILSRGISVRGTSEFNINISMLEGGKHSLPPVNTVYPPGKHSLPESSLEPSLKDISNENEKPVFLAPPKPKISNGTRYSLAVTIAEVCHVSYEAMQGRLFKVAKEIAQDERVTPELIRKVFSKGGVWYSQDWRGQKGQPPGIGDIAENLFKWDISEVNVIHGGLKDRPVKEKGGLKVNG